MPVLPKTITQFEIKSATIKRRKRAAGEREKRAARERKALPPTTLERGVIF